MNNNLDFTELQALWVSQKMTGQDGEGPGKLMKKLKALQQHQDHFNRVKILIIAIIFILLTVIFVNHQLISLLPVLGMLIVLGASVLFFRHYLKNQLNVRKLKLDAPAVDFLEHALGRLHRQNKVFGKPFQYFWLAVLVGMNVVFLGILHEEDVMSRLQIHAGFSLWLVLVSLAGLRFRQRRTRREVLPMIEELERTRKALVQQP